MELDKMYLPGEGRHVGIVGVPLGFGAGKPGSELGVSAVRMAKFQGKHVSQHIRNLGYEVTDHGDVDIDDPVYDSEEVQRPKYFREILSSSRKISDKLKEVLDKGHLPVVIGGDHSIAAGTFSGIASHFRDHDEEVGLIWFDAHADMNTPETSPSQNTHGMPLSTLLGQGMEEMVNLQGFSPKLNPKYLAHIGGRDLDDGERMMIRNLGIRDQFFTMSDIDRRGMKECVRKAIEIASEAPAGYAVTFDVDIIDPRFAPGSGTLVRGGITYREAHLALEMIAEHGGMRSFEIVEVNPTLDRSNITAKLAGELILSALGKLIL
ncbi:MAG: arginase [Acidobacteria bacterium]|nr:MAG: arginase [Acidobacteriota bacterium]REK01395.1 MAG: arginase [Acidobacteriota bacterium]REK14351.1 MAG: arginase [Acidobacteriota bacterium]REK45066.1 MAG: arginase [Acidobacteriota bacterium]